MEEKNEKRQRGRLPVLTPEIVAACRTRLEAGQATIAALAREHGVHPTTMRMACRGVTWNKRDPLSVEVPANMRRIPGHSTYFADENGQIFSIRQSRDPRPLKYGKSGQSMKVFLVGDGSKKGHTAQVHDLVCAAWHGERPSPEHRVLHEDENRENNKASNLRWAVAAEVPRRGGAAGEDHGRSKLTERDVLEILAYAKAHNRIASIARLKGVHPTTVSGIIARRLWSHVQIPESGLPEVGPIAP